MTLFLQCRQISVLFEVITDERVALCVVCDTAGEVTHYSIRHEVPGYNAMAETNEKLVFIYEDN